MDKTSHNLARVLLGVVLAFAFVPSAALASNDGLRTAYLDVSDATVDGAADANAASGTDGATEQAANSMGGASATEAGQEASKALEGAAQSAAQAAKDAQAAIDEAKRQAELKKQTYTIEYDRALIKKIGTQESTGHSICCPSFSCAYADAVMDGTVHDHSYYTCGCCTWTDWGGGNSAYRSVGSSEELLREAYDQISQGRPTVIHVGYVSGEHWVALIGYRNVTDPDHLTLDNFIALDPWDGAQIVASERCTLYGDGCEHISDR